MAGSPEVKALGGQVDAEPPRSDHPRGQTTRRAVARANGLVAETGSRVKMICGVIGDAKGFFPLPDGQGQHGRTGESTCWVSRRKLKAAILESSAVKARKV